jgi:hypothetical protein
LKHKDRGTFTVSGVGQSILDLDGITVPLSGSARIYGLTREAVVSVRIPNSLVAVLFRMLDKPVEQIPLYREGLVGFSLKKS